MLIITKKKNNNISWKYETIFLKDIKDIKIHKGYNAPQEEKYFQNGEVYFVRAGNLKNKNINYLDTSKIDKINQLACDELKINTVPKNTILFSISGKSVNTNNIAITSHKSCIVNHLIGISITDEVLLKFLFYFLSYYKTSNLSTNGSYPTIKIEAIQYLKVPIPPLKIQQKIVDEIEAIEKSKKDIKRESESLNDEVAGLIRFDGLEVQTYKFDEITTKNKIKTDVQLNKESWYNEGKYPIISQEQEFISGYTDKEDGLILNVPLITFGDHSLTIKYIDFPFFYGGDGLKFIQTNDLCKLKIFHYLLQNSTKKLKKSKDYARHFSKLKELDFNIPPLHKQNEILAKIEKIEAKIKMNKQKLIDFVNQKNLVVEKYLID